MLEMGAVPRRERERQAVAPDLHLKEEWTFAPIDARAHGRDLSISADDAGICKPARAGNCRQIGSVSGMRFLHAGFTRSEEHTSELQSPCNLVCRLLLEKKKKTIQ